MTMSSRAPRWRKIVHRTTLWLVAASAIAIGGISAQPAQKATPVETQPVVASAPDARNEIRRTLDVAQKRLEAIEASPDSALGAPPETPRRDIAERLGLARQLAGIYQQQLDVLDRMDAVRRERADAERALADWQGFSTPPPHSVLLIDEIRDDIDTADTRIANANARRVLFERFGVEIGAKSKASQGMARLAAEAAERAVGASTQAQLDWARDMATLRARVDEATRELLEMGVRTAREETDAAGVERDLALRKLAAAGTEFTLSPDDLGRMRAEIDARRRAADQAIERSLRASAAAIAARTAAETRLESARAAPPSRSEDAAARDARLAALVRDAELKREVAAAAVLRVDLLKENLLVQDGERTVWEARSTAVSSKDPVEARGIYEKVVAGLAGLRTWQEYLRQQLTAASARTREQESKLRTASGEESAHAAQLLETYRQRESDLRRAIDQGQPLERVLRHFRTDFEGRREVSYAERFKDRAAAALLWGRRIWNYEIATVDDSYETADGRKLSVSRSVTLGKSFGAVLIVVVGYLLCSFVVRRVERMFVARRKVPPQAAALLRSWILFALTAVLVVFALLSASIPLTAFAFLGGALAIAAGFGLQTLLKNFVAGLMLLLERPMRLDDLVEVDGIRGRVTAIGIRASTIMSGDGIESLIPNSAFVEGKLTNWTYSNSTSRQTIRVGVAYGSPLRKAGDALADVAARHGLVLKEPAPQVYLDEYGESAVYFALTYWVDMSPSNDSRRVRSDLLHMIDRAFAEAGIRMPFPQRDVHVDAASPLKVEIVPPPADGAGA